jgi:lipid-binding SYLF domain-containing protein
MATGSAIVRKVESFASKAVAGLRKEQELLKTLDKEVKAALGRVEAEDPGLKQFLKEAHGYAVFPAVGQAALLIGGAFGKGEVFEEEKLVGYAGLVQLTVGVQLGGQTFTQIIAFENKAALNRFKQGRTSFTANAAAVLVKAGAAAASRYDDGVVVLIYSEGGMMLELAIGGQKFVFGPALLGRGKAPVGRRARKGA